MQQVISIYKSGQEIHLEIGKYNIDVLGGWGVDLGQFSISLLHIQSGQNANCERSFWPVQSYAFDKRAKRIFKVHIVNAGTYKVDFRNPETLKVRHSILFFSSLFQDAIPHDKVSIYIH
jgi:hypothetical protein